MATFLSSFSHQHHSKFGRHFQFFKKMKFCLKTKIERENFAPVWDGSGTEPGLPTWSNFLSCLRRVGTASKVDCVISLSLSVSLSRTHTCKHTLSLPLTYLIIALSLFLNLYLPRVPHRREDIYPTLHLKSKLGCLKGFKAIDSTLSDRLLLNRFP